MKFLILVSLLFTLATAIIVGGGGGRGGYGGGSFGSSSSSEEHSHEHGHGHGHGHGNGRPPGGRRGCENGWLRFERPNGVIWCIYIATPGVTNGYLSQQEAQTACTGMGATLTGFQNNNEIDNRMHPFLYLLVSIGLAVAAVMCGGKKSAKTEKSEAAKKSSETVQIPNALLSKQVPPVPPGELAPPEAPPAENAPPQAPEEKKEAPVKSEEKKSKESKKSVEKSPKKSEKKSKKSKKSEKKSKKSEKKTKSLPSEDKPEKPEKLTTEDKTKTKEEKEKEKTAAAPSKRPEGPAEVSNPIVTPETDEFPTLEEDKEEKKDVKTAEDKSKSKNKK
uniref:C-type lectin domain-containing protein n=1 Tax=Caenorhabditis tropicalis TaxID=1561998 RepID=A0A1I7UU67_9PELO